MRHIEVDVECSAQVFGVRLLGGFGGRERTGPLRALQDKGVPAKAEPESQAEELEIMLETLAGGDVLELRKDRQGDDRPEDERSQGRVEVAAADPPGLPFPELAEPGEKPAGEDARSP